MLKSMKAFILNGLSNDHTDTYEMIADEMEKTGWQVIGFNLHEKKIAPCLGCFGCWVNQVCCLEDSLFRLAHTDDLRV
jgi:multimeric flavodoxin WrbA